MAADSRPFEVQLLDAVKSIASALKYSGSSAVSGGGGSASSSSAPSSSAALNMIASRLDAQNSIIRTQLQQIRAALICTITEDEETTEKTLGQLIVEMKTVLEDVKKALDGTTANGVAKKVEAIGTKMDTIGTKIDTVGTKIETGDSAIATQLGTTNTTLSSIQTNTGTTAERLIHDGYSAARNLDMIETNTDTLEAKLDTMNTKLDSIKTDTSSIDGKIESNGT